MNPYVLYDGDVINALQDLLDCPHGDVSGVVECNSFYVMQGFAGATDASEVAVKIATDSQVSSATYQEGRPL